MELQLDGELSTEQYDSNNPVDIEDISGNDDNNNNDSSVRGKSSSIHGPSSVSMSMLPGAGTMSKSKDHDETAKHIAELFERLNSTNEPDSNNYVLKH